MVPGLALGRILAFLLLCAGLSTFVINNNTNYEKKKETLWVSGKYLKKNWRAAGLELTTLAPSRTIVTDGNC